MFAGGRCREHKYCRLGWQGASGVGCAGVATGCLRAHTKTLATLTVDLPLICGQTFFDEGDDKDPAWVEFTEFSEDPTPD